jgi:hypothetical protein
MLSEGTFSSIVLPDTTIIVAPPLFVFVSGLRMPDVAVTTV